MDKDAGECPAFRAENFDFRLATPEIRPLYGRLKWCVVGIRYPSLIDGKPPVWRILFRSVVTVAPLMFFALDLIGILFDEKKKAWRDKVGVSKS